MSAKMFLMVIGTRPEAIKMCPLYIKMKNEGLPVSLCITAQHRSMLDLVLEFFELQPDYDLDIMSPGQNLNQIAAVLFERLNGLYSSVKPDCVIVHGDTITSVVAAWSAFHLGIKIIHIEAGLRTNNIYSPFPEEFYRQVTSKITWLHFAPTERARQNLLNEKVKPDQIFVTGNTVLDALKMGLQKLKAGFKTDGIIEIAKQLSADKKLILVTAHRRENIEVVLKELCKALIRITASHNDIQILLPVHLNQEVRAIVHEYLLDQPGIILTDPLDYPTFIYFMEQSYFILTDSGGIQEEATFIKKPVLVFRNTTERAEGIEAGNLLLTGLDENSIYDSVSKLLEDNEYYKGFINDNMPFGRGDACDKIVGVLKRNN